MCEIAREYGYEAECVEAAGYDITANFTSGERGSEFCRTVHSRVQAQCYYGVGTVLGRFTMTPAERRADCEAIASRAELVAACISGGRENLPR